MKQEEWGIKNNKKGSFGISEVRLGVRTIINFLGMAMIQETMRLLFLTSYW